MHVTCAHCQTGYRIAAEKLTRNINRVRCSRCHYVFFVPRPPGAVSQLDRAPSQSESAGVVAVSNQKGGVAKTSTCLNLGVSLARLGRRVLLVDFDPQANLTLALGYRDMPSFLEAIYRPEAVAEVVTPTRFENLHLLPSGESLEQFERKFGVKSGFERMLRDRLLPLRQNYDVVLIDTPPSMGLCTRSALHASGLVLVPTLCEYFSTYGVHRIQKAIEAIRSKSASTLDCRILVVQYDAEDPSQRAVFTRLKEGFGEKRYRTVIPYDVKMKESQILKQPVIEYDAASPSGLQYLQLAHEILEGAAAEAIRTVA